MFKILPLLALVFFVGCKKLDPQEIHEKEEIRVQYTERLNMSFPSILGFNIPWIISVPTVGATFEQKYKSNNPYLGLVEDVKPVKVKAILVDPVNKTFDFIKNKKVYIKTATQPEILLARVDNLPNNVTNEMFLIPEEGVLLDNYMTDQMEMRIEIDADKSLLQTVQVVIELTVDAKVKN